MAHKWIINDGELISGNVEFHFELHGKNTDKRKTIGGGRLHWDKENSVVYFYGVSTDYGSVTEEVFKKAFANSYISPYIKNCKIVFSNKEWLSDVLKEQNQ